MNERVIRVLWATACIAVVVASLIPVSSAPELPQYSDKLAHLACYLMLGFLAALTQRTPGGAIAAATGMVVLGVVIELAQGLLPWRSFEWLDIAANTAGAASGYGLARILARCGAPAVGGD